ncbi:MAG: GNAT family N-acetyltransferase [Oscillospiraceae bacterium]|jgi:RimJ/RimL family protein N-acetyltransferase|nr:GNAT family N-acetyltransferase [Oscillospiraceae bacterium]
MTDIELDTARLILRPFAEGDFDAARSWRNNPENARYLNWNPSDEEHFRDWRERVIERAKAEPRLKFDFAVEVRETGAVIGNCGIFAEDATFDTAGLGYILHIDHWNRGYGTELCGALLRFGFEELRLRRVTATCAAANYGSYRVMERNGMRREGTHVKAFWARVDKEWIDEAVYAILADEWRSIHGNGAGL